MLTKAGIHIAAKSTVRSLARPWDAGLRQHDSGSNYKVLFPPRGALWLLSPSGAMLAQASIRFATKPTACALARPWMLAFASMTRVWIVES